ncbi:MAG: CoA-binding protein [Dehalococcoidales bacterium]|nr:MAG: CoA-binding protein [Dehalococcoidales bacterium]
MKTDFTKLERAFNPRCVVVVGDKAESGYMWLHGQSEFKGKLYSVQVDPKEIDGIKALGVENFTSLLDVPEQVDLAIVAVPRPIAPRILEDCINKDVAAAHFFTSGFAETDTEEGIGLQRILTERASQANFHLIGPNCMGIYNPEMGIRQTMMQRTGFIGTIGFIAQSGTHAIAFSEEAYQQGLEVNKSVSFGNGIVLDSTDYLEYFGRDEGIKTIGMYLEGVRDGRRFLTTLREVAARKPVVIWKGGRTEEGGRAIASHTGSLSVPMAVWDAAVKQCGAVSVRSMEELVDALNAIQYLSPVYSNRVGITGGSGGQSVAIADVFAEAGLKVPALTQESYAELDTFFSLIGGGYRNPIDTGNVNRREMKRIMEILERDSNVDNLVLLTSVNPRMVGQIDQHIAMLSEIRGRSSKPVAVILASFGPENAETARDVAQKFRDGGIPTFTSLERGARALKKALDYHYLHST